MEFKEIKVATLSKGDMALLKEVERLKKVAEGVMLKANDHHRLFWTHLNTTYKLYDGQHYIKGNHIYRRVLK